VTTPTFTADVPRLDVRQAAALLPSNRQTAELELAVQVDGQQQVHRVSLSSAPLPRRGGRRWWWRCPRCGRRVVHLYPTNGLVCRTCAGLRYCSHYRRPC